MPWQDTQQVCLNGHQITDLYKFSPTSRKDFCTSCGAKTITNCQNCGKEIPGEVHYERVVNLSGIATSVPKICQYCGKKFPWADKLPKTTKIKKESNLADSKFTINKTIKIIGTIFTGLSILLAVLTDGFQAWDIFNPKKEKVFLPIININSSPIRINFSDNFNSDKKFDIINKVETGNGVYKFIDSISIDSFKLIDSSYFFLDISEPKMELINSTFEKMILGEVTKEEEIKLQVKGHYILKGEKTMELYLLKTDKLIASMKLNFPYYFNGMRYNQTVEVPIYTYNK
jgi:hypothetical protein